MDDFYFRIKNNLKLLKHNLKLSVDKSQKSILEKNKELKDLYLGKRCFIVGNGPSLKKQDLSLLREEIVFTVNLFPKSPLYEMVHSNFHFMVDPFIFEFGLNKEEDKEKLQLFHKINSSGSQPKCFFPYARKNVIEQYGLNDFLSIYYLSFVYEFYEKFEKNINLEKNIPGFHNVVQFAILSAIYMGFTEIYLIGCDMTGYEQISVLNGADVELHAYEMNEKEKKAIQNTHSKIYPEQFFESFYKAFADYRRLYNYSIKRGVNIYNATYGGVLDSLPRVDYNNLFN